VRSAERTDLLIALCALFISMLTAAAVIYQGKILSSQLSVTVWPYVSFQTTGSQSVIDLQVQNVGAGPALVRSAVLLVDGNAQPSLAAGLRELGYHYKHGDDVTLSSIGPGEVLRAAESVSIARIRSSQFAKRAASLETRVRIHICYCSILGDCWLAQSEVESPITVKSCDEFPRGAIAAQ
jgi:hypothetical protein